MFYQYNSIFKKTYLSSDPETTLDWSQDFALSETISGIIFFLATEFDLGLSLKLKNGLSLRFLRLRPLPATGPCCYRRAQTGASLKLVDLVYPEFNGSRMGDAGHNILLEHGCFEFKSVFTANNVIIIPSSCTKVK